MKHLSTATQKALSQKIADQTFKVHGSRLLYAKDVLTFEAADSQALRRMCAAEKTYKFEIELNAQNKLNLAFYDEANPNVLYLADFDEGSFTRLANTQNLVIDKFTEFAGHLEGLLDHCI